MNKTVEPKTLSGGLRVLPSKSASHRAVMMAAMAEGKTQLEPLQLSKDISATLACAQALGLTRGAAIAESETEGFVRAEIWGGGEGAKRALRELDCGESGSTLRFFIPLALDGRGPVRFVGHGRLMQRPLTVYEKLFAPLGVSWNQEGDALTVEGALQSGRFELPGRREQPVYHWAAARPAEARGRQRNRRHHAAGIPRVCGIDAQSAARFRRGQRMAGEWADAFCTRRTADRVARKSAYRGRLEPCGVLSGGGGNRARRNPPDRA